MARSGDGGVAGAEGLRHEKINEERPLPPLWTRSGLRPFGVREYRRALVALDPDGLGPGCWNIAFTRLRYGGLAALTRVETRTGQRTALTPRENLVVDRRCAGDSPSVYVTWDWDHAPWEFTVTPHRELLRPQS